MINKIFGIFDIIMGSLLFILVISKNYNLLLSASTGWCAGRIISEGVIELLKSKQRSNDNGN